MNKCLLFAQLLSIPSCQTQKKMRKNHSTELKQHTKKIMISCIARDKYQLKKNREQANEKHHLKFSRRIQPTTVPSLCEILAMQSVYITRKPALERHQTQVGQLYWLS